MERTKKEKSIKKFLHRTFSYIVLIIGIFAVCYSVKSITNYAITRKENENLEKQLLELKEENENLEIINQKLKDKDYFSIYVKDKYQYSSKDNSITPIN